MANQTMANPVIQVNGTATIEPSVEVATLCEVKEGQVVTTSLKVAEIFNRQHSHVLRDIRDLDCSDEFRKSNFGLTLKTTELPNNATRQDPYYYITRDGFIFLVMGFTGKTAAKFKEAYIRAFNEMEAKLRRQQEEAALASGFKQIPMKAEGATDASGKQTHTMGDMPYMVKANSWKRIFGRLTRISKGEVLMSTITIANVLNRRHGHVLTLVRGIIVKSADFMDVCGKIRETRYIDRGGRRKICYELTRDGMVLFLGAVKRITEVERGALLYAYDMAEAKRQYHSGGKPKKRQAEKHEPQPAPQPAKQPAPQPAAASMATTMPASPAELMQRFATAMAVMMGADVNQVSNLINGGNK